MRLVEKCIGKVYLTKGIKMTQMLKLVNHLVHIIIINLKYT